MTTAVVRPLVFTDRLEERRSALVAHGLRPRQEAEAGGWLDLAGAGGLVALHSAAGADEPVAEGETWLSFEVTDADTVAQALRRAGLDAIVADEAYGREVHVPTPDCATLRLGEVKHDDYGFRAHAVEAVDGPAAGVVVAEVATRDPGGWGTLIGALGLSVDADGVSYGGRRTGVVRLVAGTPATDRVTATLRVLP